MSSIRMYGIVSVIILSIIGIYDIITRGNFLIGFIAISYMIFISCMFNHNEK